MSDFEYAGELGDPDQAPFTAAVYECTTCGALVKHFAQAGHREWHRTRSTLTGSEDES